MDEITRLRRELEEERGLTQRLTSLLAQIGDNADIGTWEVDFVRGTAHWTDTTHRLHGTDPATYVPSLDTGMENIAPEHREDVLGRFNRFIEHARPDQWDLQIIRRNDGERRWVRVFAQPIVEAGRTVGVFGLFQDIHDRKLRELEAGRKDERLAHLEGLVEASPDIFAIASPNGEIIYLNRAARDIGWGPDKAMADLFPVESIAQYMSEIFPVLKTKGHWQGEIMFRDTAKNEDFPVMQTSFLLRSPVGHTTAVATIASDLRDRKRLEAELERRRIKMVQNSKLASLGEMASGIAHEINNPLAIIKGNVALVQIQLESGMPDLARLKKSAGTIDTATDRVANIIKGLRMFARDASADWPVNLMLGPVLTTTLQFCQGRFLNHGIELRVSIDPTPLPVHGRETELAQAFLNMLMNAFDASLEGTEHWVEVRLTSEGNHAVLKIVDSGPGVPVEHRQRITEPFFTTKPVGKGTGLGLSITQGIITGHGGELLLEESSPTTFVVRLPLA